MVAEKPGTLVENHYLLQNLSPPNAIGDTSWIKPGKCWRSNLTTKAAKAIIDYAAANNYQYVHYDAGWYGPERDRNSNPVTVEDGIDMPEVVRYADARGIGLICYINKIAMSRYDLDNTFKTYEKWGISGVKFGFVDWQTQADMEFLFESIRTAAKYHLVVDIHDNFRLTGIERTYPNVLTVEGILGNEERAVRNNPPKNVLITSFARMIAGAGDFTPCYLKPRVVSRSFQLALGVVFYSPLQYLHWYDQADAYAGKSFPELEFWKEMPTVWDDSKVIHGVIGEYMTVARQSGDDWFVGTITDDARSLDIPLSFLDSGKYTAKIYKEDPANKKYVTIEIIEVTSGSTITASMSSGSGHAIWIYPTETTAAANSSDEELGLHSDGGIWKFYPAQSPNEQLPDILLIGDSIMNGYHRQMIESLKEKANVYCWLTPMHLNSKNLHQDLAKVASYRNYDVIHFNIGLHGWQEGRIPEGQYQELLEAYVKVLKEHAPDARLIWAITTQVHKKGTQELDETINPIIAGRNRIADSVMKEAGVTVNNLYGLMGDKLELVRGDQWHWQKEAYEIMAQQNVEYICAKLN